MREIRFTAALLSILIVRGPAFAAAGEERGPASWVNPLIGTANGGNVFPGAVVPFGMVQFIRRRVRSTLSRQLPRRAGMSTGRIRFADLV
jgi:putative alpha-1,2-mannosidase